MVKVLKLDLDGYDGWTVRSETEIELSAFTKDGVLEHLNLDYGDDPCDSLDGFGDAITQTEHTITVNAEENGMIFVRM